MTSRIPNTNTNTMANFKEILENEYIGWSASVWAIGTMMLVYVSGVALLTRWMGNRRPIDVRRVSTIHNLCLAIFSMGLCVVSLSVGYRDGLFASHDALHCRPAISGEMVAIVYCFYVSKYWEYVDTILLIVTKKRVTWLQYLHHLSTASIVATVWYAQAPSYFFIPLIDNLVVHSIMYLYFALPRTLGWARRLITATQIFQFVHVLGYILYHATLYITGNPCGDSPEIIGYNIAWYLVYLVLFMNFYVEQFLRASRRKIDQ